MNKELIIGLVGVTLIAVIAISNQATHCVFIDPINNQEFDFYFKNDDFRMEDKNTSVLSKDNVVYFWTSSDSDGLKFPRNKLSDYGFYDIKDSFIQDNLKNCSKTMVNFLAIPENIVFYDPTDGFFGPSINFEYKND